MSLDSFLYLSNSIQGEAQDDKHKGAQGWIDILSWDWAMTQSGTTHTGQGGGGGKVDIGDITIVKYVDKSTHDLIKRCCSGEHIEKGELHVRKSGGTAPVDYLKVKMEDIMITSYQTGGSKDGLDRVQETLTLNFRRFEVIYTLQEQSGAAGPESMAGWEIAENKPWGA